MRATFTADDVRRTFKVRDAWWTVLLVDPLAAPLVRVVANRTRITPNQLSVTAFLLGLAAAAAFYFGTWPWLALGGVLFYLAFLIDCMDGKIARLKGTGSAFGQWLDWIFDRLRGFICTTTLMVGQYALTGHAWYLLLGMCLVFVDAFRYLNSLHSEKLRRDMRERVTEAMDRPANGSGREPAFIEDVLAANPDLDPEAVAARDDVIDLQRGFRERFAFYNRFRLFLRRHRLRPHAWSGIEFQMFVLIVAPITNLVAPFSIGAGVLLLCFEAILVYKLWLTTRDFERKLASLRSTGKPISQ